ncbi:MAG: hypothetical protein QF820_03325 [Acidimicrobiales bacterium]|nr:hypothetical protein [Acidimicrobiales bacterium]
MRRTDRGRFTGRLLVLGFLVLVAACGGEADVAPPTTTVAPTTTTTTTVATTTTTTTTVAPTTTTTVAPTTTTTTTLPPEPEVFAEPGDHDAGVTTIDLGDRLVEVWYPIGAGTAEGPTALVEPAEVLPEFLLELLPASLTEPFDTGAYRDAEAAEGPFPVVFYSHGFGGYRLVATTYATHLASHGFVVAAVDHLERGLVAQVSGQLVAAPGQEVIDFNRTIDILEARTSDAEDLLAGVVDTTLVAVIGHSAGGGAANQAASEPWMDAAVSIASGAGGLEATDTPYLVLAGERDSVVSPAGSYGLYEVLTGPRIYLEIAAAGHNSFTDVCPLLYESGEAAELVALIGAEQTTRAADGCTKEFVDPSAVQDLAEHATVAFLVHHFGIADVADSLGEDVLAAIGAAVPSRFESDGP